MEFKFCSECEGLLSLAVLTERGVTSCPHLHDSVMGSHECIAKPGWLYINNKFAEPLDG